MPSFTEFLPDLDVFPPASADPKATDGGGYADRARSIRKDFQRSLLNWLQSRDADALHRMSSLNRELQRLASSDEVAQLWWIASAHAELMALSPGGDEHLNRHIPARLDQLLRTLIDDGEAPLIENRDETLLREMLYDIARSNCSSALLAEVRQAFGLEDRPGSAGDEGAAELDDSVIRAFSKETMENVAALRVFLDSGDTTASPELMRALRALRTSSRALHLVEMSSLFRTLDDQLKESRDHGVKLTRTCASTIDRAAGLSLRALERLQGDRTFPAVLREEFDGLQQELEDGFEADPAVPAPDELAELTGLNELRDLVANAKQDIGNARQKTQDAPGADEVDEVDEVRMVFLDESRDILGRVNAALEGWRDDAERTSAIASIKRDLHTLKGSAHAAGFGAVGNLSHQSETLLQRAGEGVIADEQLMLLLEEVHDSLAEMTDSIRQAGEPAEQVQLMERLAELTTSMPHPALPAGPPGSEGRTSDRGDAGGQVIRPKTQAAAGHELLRIHSGRLDNLVSCAGELSITRAQLQELLSTLRTSLGDLGGQVERFGRQLRLLDHQVHTSMKTPRGQADHASVDGVETYTINELVQGLSESLSDLTAVQTGIMRYAHATETVLRQQARLGLELQDGLMSARLVPFSTIRSRLRHQARLTARELGKEVELHMTGGEVEIDRKVLEGISDALDHMVRNAVDHGLERPEERERLGKPRAGGIHIQCTQRGGEAVIRLGDDGRGLDTESIRSRAIASGLMAPEDPLTDQQVLQLIVLPGFTTAAEVTRLSGRGVGMDVVHDTVRKLGGTMTVDSRPGEGAEFEITLPVSLSITQAIFLRCGRQEFAVPLNFVQSVMKLEAGKLLPSADGRPLFEKDGEIYPLLDLAEHLDLPVEGDEKRSAILAARMGAVRIAVKVSELLGTREAVVKPLCAHLAPVAGIAGGTLRGDGRVVLVLDLPAIWAAAENREPGPADASGAAGEVPLVMVVDDSMTVRKVTANNLAGHGMAVAMARDGVEALEQMGARRPDLMLVDIEMPRMDGYELTRRVREDPATRDIPIIVITSRAGDGNQERAFSLGADDYLVKPYQEQELVVRVEQALAASRFRKANDNRATS